jgi:hypothetical protein
MKNNTLTPTQKTLIIACFNELLQQRSAKDNYVLLREIQHFVCTENAYEPICKIVDMNTILEAFRSVFNEINTGVNYQDTNEMYFNCVSNLLEQRNAFMNYDIMRDAQYFVCISRLNKESVQKGLPEMIVILEQIRELFLTIKHVTEKENFEKFKGQMVAGLENVATNLEQIK